MEYLKVPTDFGKAMAALGDAERGRLFTAMLFYAADGTVPDLRGNERFMWPTAKLNIDREASYLDRQRQNAFRGKKPLEANSSQVEPLEATPSQVEPTEATSSHFEPTFSEREKEKEKKKNQKEKNKEKEKENSLSEVTTADEKRVFSRDSKPYQVAKYLDECICERAGKNPSSEATIQAWAGDIDKTHRIDGYSWETIEDVMIWCQDDSFWNKNILSGAKFRKQFVALKMRVDELK